MKSFAIFIFSLLLLSACSSKPTFDTSLLIGKWVTTQSEVEDGIETITIMCYNFVNEKDLYIEAKYNIDGDYYGQLTCEGTYKVSGDKIIMEVPQSNIQFSLNRNFFDSKYEYEEALRETRNEIFKDFESSSESKILSLFSDKLLLSEDGVILEFDKYKE